MPLPGADAVEVRDEESVQLSIQLAHEYVKLGKLRDAGIVYKRSLSSPHIQTASNETRVILLLRHAESVIKIGDVNQGYVRSSPPSPRSNFATSIALYTEALQLSESLPTNEKESSTADRVHSHVNRLRRIALAATVFAEIKLAQVNILLSGVRPFVLTNFRTIRPRPFRAFYKRIGYGIVLSMRCLTFALKKVPRIAPPLYPTPSICLQTGERHRQRKTTIFLLIRSYITLARPRTAWNGILLRACSRQLYQSQTSISAVDPYERPSISYENLNDSPDL